MIHKTNAFILKRFDYRETSLIVHFFTQEYGKLKGILKGYRKSPRNFNSPVDRGTLNEIQFYRYSKSELHLISHCDLKKDFYPLKQHYRKNIAIQYALELVDQVVELEQPLPDIFCLLLDYYHSLEKIDNEKQINLLVHFFQIKILQLSGFNPHIECCVHCDQEIDGPSQFSVEHGGLVCDRSKHPGQGSTFPISAGAIATLRYAQVHPWQQCVRMKMTEGVQHELKSLLNKFLVFHFEKKIKAQAYLNV